MWYDAPIPRRASSNHFVDPLNGKEYTTGEFLPFYVPRPIMPQIDESDYDDFLRFVASKGVAVAHKKVSTRDVRPHQRIDKIAIQRMPEAARQKPVFISIDGYILDGNHRWAFHIMMHDQELPAIELGLPFEEAIKLMFSFEKTYTLESHKEGN